MSDRDKLIKGLEDEIVRVNEYQALYLREMWRLKEELDKAKCHCLR